MGVYIKDIEKPKNCVECPFKRDGECLARAEADDFDSYQQLYQHCPLIEIPIPHGRLIDASELIKSYMKGTKTDIDDFYATIDIIDNAPTILEAER